MDNKQHELTWSLQVSYLAMFLAGMACGLWQKGHVKLTVALLAAGLPLLLLSRIPFRWFPGWLRQIGQLIIGALAFAWIYFRLPQTTADIALVETGAIITSALFLGGILREHSLMALICIVMAGYGGLTPGRPIFLPSFLATIGMGILILYQTRTLMLTHLGNKHRVPRIPHHIGNWFYRAGHFVFVFLLAFIFLTQLPQNKRIRSRGLIPVSYHSEEDLLFPELWGRWSAPIRQMLSDSPKAKEESDGTKKPTPTEKKSLAELKNSDLRSFDARTGDGKGASIGSDLVFRAYTPAKLYWVMQIYDTYNGEKWTQSRILLSGRGGADNYEPRQYAEVVQSIAIEKPLSLRLPYAHRLQQAMYRDQSIGSVGNPTAAILQRPDAVSLMLKTKNLMEPPWHYRVQSCVPLPDLRPDPRPWLEPAHNFGWNYRALPQRLVSKRLRQLALDLTENALTPMDKANTLRDYLRNNFRYTLEPAPIPPGHEIVDFFLFESREGYCQHFAQALVVLARLAGLHARLVTGFSPGKYNLLSNYFEVYEYHAHAWTQIFIEPYGWLTYDGVPPGELRMENTMSLLKPLLDPFGDQWGAIPPELSFRPPEAPKRAQSSSQQDGGSESKSAAAQKADQLYESIYTKAAMENSTVEPDARQLAAAAIAMLKDKIAAMGKEQLAQFRDSLRHGWERMLVITQRFLAACKRLSLTDYFLIAFALSLLHWLWSSRRNIQRQLRRYWQIFGCYRLWRRLRKLPMPPAMLVSSCQDLLCRQLALAQFPHPPTVDLVERAEIINHYADSLSEDYLTVASAAAQTWYSPRQPGPHEAEQVLAATARFQLKIKPFIRLADQNRRPRCAK
ncbi:MAG: transglutaminase-like domain-containing protein [Lentisphaeria bacterium]|jgi:hypothetical protein